MTAQQTGIAISMPCGQNWQAMQAVAPGRYCTTCNQTVTDFTAMADAEVLAWIRKNGFSGCGRFRTNQVNRPLQQIHSSQHQFIMKQFFTALFGSLMLNSAAAQLPVYDTSVYTWLRSAKTDSVLLAQQQQFAETSFRLQGTITNELGQPLPGALLRTGNPAQTTRTDEKGNFDWLLPHQLLRPYNIISITAPGKAAQTRSIHWTAIPALLHITMAPPSPCACPVVMGTIQPGLCCDLNISMSVDKMFVPDKKAVRKKHR